MNLADWLIVICIALRGLVGMTRGLAASLFGVLGSVGGLVIAWRAAGPLTTLLETTTGVVTGLAGLFTRFTERAIPALAGAGTQLTQAKLEQLLGTQALPATVRDHLAASLPDTTAMIRQAGSLAAVVSRTLATVLITALIFAIIYQLCRFLGAALAYQLSRAVRNTPLSLPNHLGGLLFGLFEGAVAAMLAIGLIGLIMPLFPAGNFVATTLAGSRVAQMLEGAFYALIPVKTLLPGAVR